MKEIRLTTGQVSLVDDEDLERITKYKWGAFFNGYSFYASRVVKIRGKRTSVSMHRMIMGLAYGDRLQYVDHINRNGLDNRKENLRVATPPLSNYNQKKRKDNSSGYRGVSWCKRTGRWRASIQINGHSKSCGYHNNPITAALAYDNMAKKIAGEYANLNFLKGGM